MRRRQSSLFSLLKINLYGHRLSGAFHADKYVHRCRLFELAALLARTLVVLFVSLDLACNHLFSLLASVYTRLVLCTMLLYGTDHWMPALAMLRRGLCISFACQRTSTQTPSFSPPSNARLHRLPSHKLTSTIHSFSLFLSPQNTRPAPKNKTKQ